MGVASNSILPLILVAIGIGCVILSFLVPDRKKSLISLSLAGLIILTGIVHLASGTISRYRWNQRMKSMQRERQADLDALREKMKDNLPKPATTPAKN